VARQKSSGGSEAFNAKAAEYNRRSRQKKKERLAMDPNLHAATILLEAHEKSMKILVKAGEKQQALLVGARQKEMKFLVKAGAKNQKLVAKVLRDGLLRDQQVQARAGWLSR
jgi:ribosomal protein L28